MINSHTDLLNLIAGKISAKYYLEIGIFNPSHNFNLINIENKVGVDPAIQDNSNNIFQITSDDYFNISTTCFDLVWIDGLHEKEQVKRDIINSWDRLDTGGIILLHDCNPLKESITHVPRDSREWCGDVYKTICQLISPKFTIDFDYGCTLIMKRQDSKLEWSTKEITWDYFDKNRKQLLNLISLEDAIKIINTLC